MTDSNAVPLDEIYPTVKKILMLSIARSMAHWNENQATPCRRCSKLALQPCTRLAKASRPPCGSACW